MPESFKATAPGSIMLLGEHAVLYGYHSVVAAVNREITVTLTPRSDREIHIVSDRLGEYVTTLEQFSIERPFHFVLSAIHAFLNHIVTGFDLKIESQFSDQLGLGSSAAVTVALVTVLKKWLSQSLALHEIYLSALSVVRTVQGTGSGADVAASVYGGALLYRINPFSCEHLSIEMPLHLVYVGYKTPTVEVIKKVKHFMESNPEKYNDLYRAIDSCASHGFETMKLKRWRELGALFEEHQLLQRQLGVSDMQIDSLLETILQQPTVFGAKISGAGLGDCIVVLGTLSSNTFPQDKKQTEQGVCQIDIKIATQGVTYESI